MSRKPTSLSVCFVYPLVARQANAVISAALLQCLHCSCGCTDSRWLSCLRVEKHVLFNSLWMYRLTLRPIISFQKLESALRRVALVAFVQFSHDIALPILLANVHGSFVRDPQQN